MARHNEKNVKTQKKVKSLERVEYESTPAYERALARALAAQEMEKQTGAIIPQETEDEVFERQMNEAIKASTILNNPSVQKENDDAIALMMVAMAESVNKDFVDLPAEKKDDDDVMIIEMPKKTPVYINVEDGNDDDDVSDRIKELVNVKEEKKKSNKRKRVIIKSDSESEDECEQPAAKKITTSPALPVLVPSVEKIARVELPEDEVHECLEYIRKTTAKINSIEILLNKPTTFKDLNQAWFAESKVKVSDILADDLQKKVLMDLVIKYEKKLTLLQEEEKLWKEQIAVLEAKKNESLKKVDVEEEEEEKSELEESDGDCDERSDVDTSDEERALEENKKRIEAKWIKIAAENKLKKAAAEKERLRKRDEVLNKFFKN